LLEVVFVAVPSAVLLWINGNALISDPSNRVDWAMVAVLSAGLIITVAITASRRPLELYASSVRPFAVTKVDAVAALSVVAIGAAVVAFALYPVDSAHIIGMFPGSCWHSGRNAPDGGNILPGRISVAIISSLITGRPVPARHRPGGVSAPRVSLQEVAVADKSAELGVADVKAQRKIPTSQRHFTNGSSIVARRRGVQEEGSAHQSSLFPVGRMYAAHHPRCRWRASPINVPSLPITSGSARLGRQPRGGRAELLRPSRHGAERSGEPVRELQPYGWSRGRQCCRRRLGSFSAPTSSRRSLPAPYFRHP
jgi:hypothetical protein